MRWMTEHEWTRGRWAGKKGYVGNIARALGGANGVVDSDRRIVRAVVTEEIADRASMGEDGLPDGDVVRAEGGVLADFMRNPVVPFAHDYWELPVGRVVQASVEVGAGATVYDYTGSGRFSVRRLGRDALSSTLGYRGDEEDERPRMVERIQLVPPAITPLADASWAMIEGDFLRSWSIGFLSIEEELREKRAATDEDEWRYVPRIFVRWYKLETSLAPVPMLQSALNEDAGEAARTYRAVLEEVVGRLAADGMDESRIRALGEATAALALGTGPEETAPEDGGGAPPTSRPNDGSRNGGRGEDHRDEALSLARSATADVIARQIARQEIERLTR